MEKKDYIQTGLLVTILVFVIAIFFIVIFKGNGSNGAEEKVYDVSMMNTVSVSDVLDMFNDSETYVLYIGRETCGVCVNLLPTLKQAQIDNGYITQYLDITAVDRSSEEWENVVKKLDITTTAELSETDGSGAEVVTETFGYFLDNYGFTPTVVIIKDGKQVAGFVGSKSLSEFNSWYEKYGE